MRIIRGVEQNEVWNHWKKVEQIPETDIWWRWDIRSPLPKNLKWFLTEIEEKDIEKIFIISSDDWKDITKTFRLIDTIQSLNTKNNDLIKNILAKKEIYERNINGLDKKFILVSPASNGNFTIIEGNKRAVALLSIKQLIGNQIYLGISNKIKNYKWARYSLL